MKENRPLYAFFGHHKGATDWTNSILSEICHELKLRFAVVHYPDMFQGNLVRFVKENKIDFLSYDNADYTYVEELEHFKAFHTVRDPRDITVSAYYSHLYSHGTERSVWVDQRKQLQSMSKTDGLLYEMQSREQQFREMYEWNYAQPNVLEMRMEDLTQNPYAYFTDIFQFLELLDETVAGAKDRLIYSIYTGLRKVETLSKGRVFGSIAPDRLPVERLLGIIWKNDFSRKAGGRKHGQEDVKSHYRKGTPGDWVNHFESAHFDYFCERYNDLLIKLGYEQDQNWRVHYEIDRTEQKQEATKRELESDSSVLESV